MSGDIDGVQVEWSVPAITVGARHRKELGDIDTLAASIKRVGLLQPITITPDGSLVCGARRLAAVKLLGKKTINVWVRSGISDRLGKLLAEQDDNVLHKPLTPMEGAALFRELKALMAEDAARREEATRFTSENQPGKDGGAAVAPPELGALGKTREQSAAMIPGGLSYTSYDKIGYLEQVASDPNRPEHLRNEARRALEEIEAGGSIGPAYARIREQAEGQAVEDLHQIAEETLARVHAENKAAKKKNKPRKPSPAPAREIVQFPVRAFVLTWGELIDWWERYDLHQIATELTDEQADAFYATVEGTVAFAARLRTARDEADGAEDEGAPMLRAL